MNEAPFYSTYDLYLAVFLLAKGEEMAPPIVMNKRVNFRFKGDMTKLLHLAASYLNPETQVSAWRFASAMKSMKRFIHEVAEK